MKINFRLLSRLGLCFCVGVVLFSAIAAVAQRSGDQAAGAIFAGAFLVFALAIALVVYIYIALALQTIAAKTGTPNAWLAWIPIVNIFLMLSIAKKPAWWFLLFLIPLVNLIICIIVWMGVAKARNKPDWLGILMIVPLANIVIPGYLAWAD
jgi:hypothetical protein